jgi:hypothetical protein
VTWEVEVTNRFAEWYRDEVPNEDVNTIDNAIDELRFGGPALGRPRVDAVRGSRHSRMKELRVQSRGNPIRIFFAFDPRRVAILLLAGEKTGDMRFYERMIPLADDLYEEHLKKIAEDQRG